PPPGGEWAACRGCRPCGRPRVRVRSWPGSSSDRRKVGREAGLALEEAVPGRLEPELGGDAGHQRLLVAVGLQKRPERNPEVAEQAQPEVAARGHAQAVAARAEVLR